MRGVLVVFLCLAGCGSFAGQKVTVLLSEREVVCEEEGDGEVLARLQLDQPEDMYQAEFVEPGSNVVRTIEGFRQGLDVVFACPDGVGSFQVRHATVLQARAAATPGPTTPADGGGVVAPTTD